MALQFEVFPVVGPNDNPRANGKVFQSLWTIREMGSLHHAAKQVGLLYRHAWGMMQLQEEMPDRVPLDMERGRGASPTLFGECVLRIKVRLRERIGLALHQAMGQFPLELEDTSQSQTRICFSGSHDPTVELPAEAFARQSPGIYIDTVFCGAVEGLICLQEKQYEVAGFYVVPQQGAGSIARQILRKRSHLTATRLIALADHKQGLMMSAEWAGRVQSLGGAAHTQARFVNRQHGSGARLPFDQLLAAVGLYPDQISGYDEQEFSSDKIIMAVQERQADVGFSLRPGVETRGLHFIPLTRETYYLTVCHDNALSSWVREPIGCIRQPVLHEGLGHLAGYRPTEHASLLTAEQALLRYADEACALAR